LPAQQRDLRHGETHPAAAAFALIESGIAARLPHDIQRRLALGTGRGTPEWASSLSRLAAGSLLNSS